MGGMGANYLLGGGGRRLESEVGYGLPIGARFVGTPRAGIRTSEYGRDYRFGYSIEALEQRNLRLQLGIEAGRRQNPVFGLHGEAGGTDQRVLGQATIEWSVDHEEHARSRRWCGRNQWRLREKSASPERRGPVAEDRSTTRREGSVSVFLLRRRLPL